MFRNYLLRPFFIITFFSTLILFTNCSSENEDDDRRFESFAKKKGFENEILTQDKKNDINAAQNNVKSRKLVTYFYDKFGKIAERGYEVQKSIYNENGNKITVTDFLGTGDIDLKYVYNYDDYGNLLEFRVEDIWEQVVTKTNYVYNENGQKIKEYDLNLKTNKYRSIHYSYEGDFINKIEFFDENDNLFKYSEISKDVEKKMFHEKSFDAKKELKYYTNKFYNENNIISKEEKIVENLNPQIRENIFDDDDNLIEIKASIYNHKFIYDEANNVLEDKMFNSEGGRQHLFKNKYDKNGLLIERVRYDGDDKPVILNRYIYEFY